MPPRFAVGVDLGTTNTVIAVADLDDDELKISVAPIPQLIAPNTVESLASLPSFLYLATEDEQENRSLAAPFDEPRCVVGGYARRRAAETPQRTIVAAKSWLGHHGVDRRQPILPWQAPDEVGAVSPLEVTRRYLQHVVAAFGEAHPEAPLDQQHVVLTVPASFDASARELTREAALEAGFPEAFVLLEEPQAAVYAWLHAQGDRWRENLATGDVLLVCDVGGGTTDLTLIEASEDQGELLLQRRAVGDHLLVGGDNMDLALAHLVAEKIRAEQDVDLDPWQSVALWHSCRDAKESLLRDGPEKLSVSIAGRGGSIISGAISVELNRDEVREFLLEGFFPLCEADAKPQRGPAVGLQEIGLPFETDVAITRHVADFLSSHGDASGPAAPTRVLFNGGVFQAKALQQRLLKAMAAWRGKPARLAGQQELHDAVARGAAYYAWTKQRGGVRIRGGTARSYYVGIEVAGLAIPGAPRPLRALCVAPIGMEEGTSADVPSDDIGLVVGQKIAFRFFASSTRKQDQPGVVLRRWSPEELHEMPPVIAEAPRDASIDEPFLPVRFQTRISELGMFELWCVSPKTGGQWKLEFSARQTQ